MEENKKDYPHPHLITQELIHKHSYGYLRDEYDLKDAKTHTAISIQVITTFINTYYDTCTKDELKEIVKEAFDGIELFKAK